MGTDVSLIGLKHRLSTREPAKLITQLADTFGRPISIVHYESEKVVLGTYCRDKYYNVPEDKFIELYLPECDYLTHVVNQIRNNEKLFDLTDSKLVSAIVESLSNGYGQYELYKLPPDDDTEINIYLENFELFKGDRWWWITRWFEEGLDSDGAASFYSARNSLLQYDNAFGCSTLLYFPDQTTAGCYLTDEVYLPADKLLQYVVSKEYCRTWWEAGHAPKRFKSVEEYENSCHVINIQEWLEGKISLIPDTDSVEAIIDQINTDL